jgi:hypothetical protein
MYDVQDMQQEAEQTNMMTIEEIEDELVLVFSRHWLNEVYEDKMMSTTIAFSEMKTYL